MHVVWIAAHLIKIYFIQAYYEIYENDQTHVRNIYFIKIVDRFKKTLFKHNSSVLPGK